MKVSSVATCFMQLVVLCTNKIKAENTSNTQVEEPDFIQHHSVRRLERDLQIINTIASSSQQSYEAALATDGDIFTRWESLPIDDEWIYVQFSTVHLLDAVTINWETAHALRYDLEVSDDAVSWTTVAEVRNSAGGEEIIDLEETASGRYLRMKGIRRATIHGYSIREMTVTRYESAYVPIIGATASSEEDGNLAEYAVDSDFATRWASIRDRDNEWISIEFDQSYPLSLGIFSWESAYGVDYDVQTSEDGSTWTTVVEVRGRTGGIDVINFPLGTVATYVRMLGITRGTRYGYSLYDVSFQEGTAPPDLPDLPPVTTSASSYEEQNFPFQATDDNLETRWASIRGLDNEWLAIDYGILQIFSRVELYWEVAYGVDYDIQVSNDGNTWRTVLQVRNGDGDVDILDLPAGVSGRAIRMLGISRATKYGFSLWEMIVERPQDVLPPDDPQDIVFVDATASSNLAASMYPSLAIDGRLETAWASMNPPNIVDGEVLELQLDEFYTVSLVAVAWEASAHAREYKVQLSRNKQVWRTVASVSSDGFDSVDTIPVTSDFKATYLRIKCLVPGQNGAYAIREVTAQGFLA